MVDLAARTVENTEYLKNLGFNVVEIIEYEWLILSKRKIAQPDVSTGCSHPGAK